MKATSRIPAEGPPPVASRHLDAPVVSTDLAEEAAELRRGEAFREHGHSAKTLAKYPDLRVVLLVLRAGASLGKHGTAEAISILTLAGRVRLDAGGKVLELPAGCLVALEHGKPHDVLALKDSDVLLTVGWGDPSRRAAS